MRLQHVYHLAKNYDKRSKGHLTENHQIYENVRYKKVEHLKHMSLPYITQTVRKFRMRQVDNMVAFKSNSTCRNHWPCHMEVMQLHRMTTFRFQHAHIT